MFTLSNDTIQFLTDIKTPKIKSSGEHLFSELHVLQYMIDCIANLRDLHNYNATKLPPQSSGIKPLHTTFLSQVIRILKYSVMPSSALFHSTDLTARLDLCQHILSKFPELTRVPINKKQQTIMHYAAYYSDSSKFLELIRASFPGSVELCDASGAQPIHYSVLHAKSNENYLYLKAHASSIVVSDNHGYTPLHWAVNQPQPSYAIITDLVHTVTLAAVCRNHTTPLHWAVTTALPSALLQTMITTYPAALSVADNNGLLPLHYACCYGASQSVLQEVIAAHPAAVTHLTTTKSTPLHLLINTTASMETMMYLMQQNIKALNVADDEMYLPLHIALDRPDPQPKLIRQLLHNNFDSVRQKTIDGYLPLHFAMLHYPEANTITQLEIIGELVSLYPDAVNESTVDIVPSDASVTDVSSYAGPYMKKRWTPMSKAIIYNDARLLSLLRNISNTLSPTKQKNASPLKTQKSLASLSSLPPIATNTNTPPRAADDKVSPMRRTPSSSGNVRRVKKVKSHRYQQPDASDDDKGYMRQISDISDVSAHPPPGRGNRMSPTGEKHANKDFLITESHHRGVDILEMV